MANPSNSPQTANTVIAFWRAAGPDRWFKKDDAFDLAVRAQFLSTYEAAAGRHLAEWEATADGALGLVIILDQFPRNMFRGSARTYAADPLARAVADRAIGRRFDQATEPTMRQFFYLPFMHSEQLVDQDRSLQLYEALGDADLLVYAKEHRDIIARFGRFPHRNPLLGRTSTAAEREFLEKGGFAG